MFRFCYGKTQGGDLAFDDQDTCVPVVPPVPQIPVLLEIVGATDLPTKPGKRPGEKILPDPFAVVSMMGCNNDKGGITTRLAVVHKTQTIYKQDNPIWTVKTKSLCIVEIPDYKAAQQQQLQKDSIDKEHSNDLSTSPSHDSQDTPDWNYLIIQVFSGKNSLGKVKVSLEHILQCNGERQEYPLVADIPLGSCPGETTSSSNNNNADDNPQPSLQSLLALRFRRAKAGDSVFLRNLQQRQDRENLLVSAVSASARQVRSSLTAAATTVSEPTPCQEAMDVDFRRVIKNNSLFLSHQKECPTTGNRLFRVQPPKKSLPHGSVVEWMTKAQIQQAAVEPSEHWVVAGHGEAGTLYLEILGCNDLPAMVRTYY
jgi:C2 domain